MRKLRQYTRCGAQRIRGRDITQPNIKTSTGAGLHAQPMTKLLLEAGGYQEGKVLSNGSHIDALRARLPLV